MMHKEAAKGRWFLLSLEEQLGNIGSEVGRTRKWLEINEKNANNAANRALELFDLTLSDERWKGRRIEIARAREIFCDAVFGDRNFEGTLEFLEKYFMQFAMMARINKK